MTAILNMASTAMLMMAVGQTLDLAQFAGVGVGLSVFNMVFNGPTLGFAASLDTLATAAYGRNPTGTEVGRLTQLGFALGVLLCIPISLFFIFISPPFVGFVFGTQYVDSASTFLLWTVPAVFTYAPMLVIQRSLQAELLSRPSMLSTFFSTAATLVGCFTLVPTFKIIGVSLTLFVCYMVQLIAMLYFAPAEALFKKVSWHRAFILPVVSRGEDMGDFWEVMEPHRVKAYVKVAATTMIAVCVGFWTWEFILIIAARLGEKEVAVFNIFMNVVNLTWCVSQGFGSAASSYVGKFLGMGYGNLAMAYARTSSILSQFTQWGNVVLIIFFHRYLFGFYTDSEPVLDMLHDNLGAILIVVTFCDLQYVGFSIFRGCNRQHEAPWIAAFAWLVVGIPFGWYLAISRGEGASGLLFGINCGYLVLSPMQVARFMMWSWPELAKEASQKMVQESSGKNSDSLLHQRGNEGDHDGGLSSIASAEPIVVVASSASSTAVALHQDRKSEDDSSKTCVTSTLIEGQNNNNNKNNNSSATESSTTNIISIGENSNASSVNIMIEHQQQQKFYDDITSNASITNLAVSNLVGAPPLGQSMLLGPMPILTPTLTATELETERENQLPFTLKDNVDLYKASVEVTLKQEQRSSIGGTPIDLHHIENQSTTNNNGIPNSSSSQQTTTQNETFSIYLEKTPNLAPSAIATAIMNELEDFNFVVPTSSSSKQHSPSSANGNNINNNKPHFPHAPSSSFQLNSSHLAVAEKISRRSTSTELRQKSGDLFHHLQQQQPRQSSLDDFYPQQQQQQNQEVMSEKDDKATTLINVYVVHDEESSATPNSNVGHQQQSSRQPQSQPLETTKKNE